MTFEKPSRVDHQILLTKIANTGLPDFVTRWITSFLCERRQRVKLGNIKSDWAQTNAGVPQGTLLGPTCFLLHINDLRPLCSTVKYVDDSTEWEACSTSGNNSQLQLSADQTAEWSRRNHMQLNCDKTKEILVHVGKKPCNIPPLTVDGVEIERVTQTKLLGVIFSNSLDWDAHVDYMCSKASRRLYFLTLLRRAGVDAKDIVSVFTSIVRSVLEYACEVWHPGLTQEQTSALEHIQKRALRTAFPHLDYEEALSATGLERLSTRRENACRTFFVSMLQDTHKLHHLIPPPRTLRPNLRNANMYPLPRVKTQRFKRSLVVHGLYHFQK